MKRSARPTRLGTADIERHYHPLPYATFVLEGGYEEAGDQGRLKVTTGDLLLHPAFSAHRDLVGRSRTYVLDVPLPFDGRTWPALARVADADLLIALASRDIRDARALIVDSLVAVALERDDPADRLADALTGEPSLAIGKWAEFNGYSREWLSRRFRRFYGVDSALYRSEARTRRAWAMIVGTGEPLAQIAADCGFADQAHMTRAVGHLTGRTPQSWRRNRPITSVQEDR
jgi:AraC-like DNA-binding protein